MTALAPLRELPWAQVQAGQRLLLQPGCLCPCEARLEPGDLCLVLVDQVEEALAHLAKRVAEPVV